MSKLNQREVKLLRDRRSLLKGWLAPMKKLKKVDRPTSYNSIINELKTLQSWLKA